MRKCVLVTGASGLIGTKLIDELILNNYRIHALTRSGKETDTPYITYFKWDVDNGTIDEDCIQGVDAIVHLAGENIGALPWSRKRRKAIVESRTKSIELVYQLLKIDMHSVKAVISASATGYYNDRGDEVMTEDKAPSRDFLGYTGKAWERAVYNVPDPGTRIVCLRSAVILDKCAGMYPKLASVFRSGLGTVLGNGKQWMPWIHVDDAVAAYKFALQNSTLSGSFNMVAPEQVQATTFMDKLAASVGRKIWLPPVPAFLIKAVLGQMSQLVLSSTRASAAKLEQSGFTFQYPTLAEALADLAED